MLREFYQSLESDAKAFPYRVELTDAGGPLLSGGGPMAYNDYNGFNTGGRIGSLLSQREAKLHMQTYGGSESIDWLMDAVNFTATAGASAEFHFRQGQTELAIEKKPSDPPDTKLAPQDAINLFTEPNPHMGWSDLFELSLIDFLIVGNCYWVKWRMNKDGKPLALYRMAPDCVKIEPGPFGPKNYLYRLPGQRQDTVFPAEQVVHFKRPNPNDAYYGLGVVKGGARALDMEVELTKTMANYYAKQALPSGVVSTDRRVPRDVFNKLKTQLRSFYSGGNNAGQLMVLEAGLKFTTVSPTAGDALFAEMGTWSRDRIFAMFNLNKGLVGMWDGTGDPKIADWQLLFDRKTMIPLTKKFAGVISRQLTRQGWGLDFCIDYEETQNPDQILNRAGTVAKLPGVKVHEVRDAAGLPPSTGDKEIDETVLNMPGPNMDQNGQGGTADNNLPGEAGRPPKQENTLAFAKRAPAARAGGSATRVPKNVVGKKSLDDHLADIDAHLANIKAMAPADHVHVGKLSGDHVTPPEDLLHKKRTSEIDVLVSDVESQLKKAASALERGLLDAHEGKADGTAYQRIKNSPAWKTFQDKLDSILTDAAQVALSLANVHHAANGYDSADMDIEGEAEAIVKRPDGGLTSLIKTLKNMIGKRVLASQQKGNATDIEGDIRDAISTWSGDNAAKIATDVATIAYNTGTLEVAEANNFTHVLVSDGEDFDEPCIAANGEVWTIAKARKNQQEHPNCRRAFVPTTEA